MFFRIFPIPAWIMLGLWFAIQLFSGIGADPTVGGVAYWAHAGGFVIGIILTLPVFLRRGGTDVLEPHRRPPAPPRGNIQAVQLAHPQSQSQVTQATCHCGAVELSVHLTDGLNTARRCDCSFCRRRGAAAVSAPLDGVTVVKGADQLGLYTWGTGTAQALFLQDLRHLHPPPTALKSR